MPVSNPFVFKTKVITATRDMTAASGDVAYTGVGFKPKAIIAFAVKTGAALQASWGMVDSALKEESIMAGYNGTAGRFDPTAGYFLKIEAVAGVSQDAIVKSLDADGFTLTWVKTGTPAAGTVGMNFLCLG